MRCSTWKLLSLFGVVVAGAIAAPAGAEVLVGLATPLTGHMAWAGASNQVGAESAIADLNAMGGVLGEQIRVISVDDACDAEQAVATQES
jgi:branched-chain amino acid transport system substrate-binding protein